MVRGGPANRAVKRAKVFALTKGFRGRRRNCYSLAVRAAHKALQYAYISRRLKKRDMRKLWIQRINFAAQSHNISYARFMNSLVKCNIQLNRKVLSELAIHEPRSFAAIAGIAQQRWKYGLICYLNEDPFNLEAVSKFPQRQFGVAPHTAVLYDTEGAVLYQSRTVVDEHTGRLVKETAV